MPKQHDRRDGEAQSALLRSWRNPEVRAVIYQVAVLAGVIAFVGYLVHNTIENLEARSIRSGFGFLAHEAGFAIGESPIVDYQASDSYATAFLVGMLNTLRVAALGIIFATILGTIIGVSRLSSNWLVARICSAYIEVMRNIPLLLQLFFWYAVITGLLPAARNALLIFPGTFISSSGLQFAVPVAHPVYPFMGVAFLVAAAASWALYKAQKRRQARTGKEPRPFLPTICLLLGLPLVVWLLGGAPLNWDIPVAGRFRLEGGTSITPEFTALLLGLSLYTAAFIAEIVRAGILAVPWGQTEAAASLGLRRGLVTRLVLLPQALRVIVPPTTSQYLNLTKNSSLAVAIGYPDLVSIGNTSLNQTGQALECIAIMMAVYLTISLSISFFMNWYNTHIALVER